MSGQSTAESTASVGVTAGPSKPWPVIVTSLLASLLAISTLFMHSWMSQSGTVEINTPELQGKEVDWELEYGLWESISHFGEEVEVTDYDCGVNDLECRGFKTAGIVTIVLIVLGVLTAISSLFLNLTEKALPPILRVRMGVLGGGLILVAPIIWAILLPGVFPPIEGMGVGLAFWLAMVSGVIGVSGGALSCIQARKGVGA